MDIQYILLASFVSMLWPKMTRSYVIGCYEASDAWDYAADGVSSNLLCNDHCFQTQNKIYSSMFAHVCNCRHDKPPDSYLVDDTLCDISCGWEFCGGFGNPKLHYITVSQKEPPDDITVVTTINIDGTVTTSSYSTTMIDTTQAFTVKTTTEQTTTKSDAISHETTETAPASTTTESDTISIEIMETTTELSTTESRTTAVEMTRGTDSTFKTVTVPSLAITTETSPETMTNQPAGLLHCSLNVIMVRSTSPITGIEKLLVNPSTSNKMAYEGIVMITFKTESRIACVAKCSVLNDCFVAEFRKAMKECMLKSKYNQYGCETNLDNEVVSFIIR